MRMNCQGANVQKIGARLVYGQSPVTYVAHNTLLQEATVATIRRFVPLRFCVAKIWPGTRLWSDMKEDITD